MAQDNILLASLIFCTCSARDNRILDFFFGFSAESVAQESPVRCHLETTVSRMQQLMGDSRYHQKVFPGFLCPKSWLLLQGLQKSFILFSMEYKRIACLVKVWPWWMSSGLPGHMQGCIAANIKNFTHLAVWHPSCSLSAGRTPLCVRGRRGRTWRTWEGRTRREKEGPSSWKKVETQLKLFIKFIPLLCYF